MKPQEKMDWFWVTGVLPGTIFDDFGDHKTDKEATWSRLRRLFARHSFGRANR